MISCGPQNNLDIESRINKLLVNNKSNMILSCISEWVLFLWQHKDTVLFFVGPVQWNIGDTLLISHL